MPVTAQSMRHFLLIVLGQTVSVFGSQLTSFVLGVWIYQRSGSATQFSLIIFFALLIVAIAGMVLVQQAERRIPVQYGKNMPDFAVVPADLLERQAELRPWFLRSWDFVGTLEPK